MAPSSKAPPRHPQGANLGSNSILKFLQDSHSSPGTLSQPWDNLESNPRTAPTARIRLVTYNNWFAVPHGTGGTQEKGYPPGMPNYIKHSGGIPFSQIKQLIRFRTGAHHLRVETERWVPAPARLPRSERVCQKCTGLLLTGSTGQHMASRNGLA